MVKTNRKMIYIYIYMYVYIFMIWVFHSELLVYRRVTTEILFILRIVH